MSLITLTVGSVVFAQKPHETANQTPEQQVRAMIEQYRVALTKHDIAALERIWADDYTFINASGAVVTKAERLANIKSGATRLDTIEREEDLKIRVYGGDVAVAVDRVTLKGQYSGKSTSGQFRSSHTWVKLANRWQLVCNQITPSASR